MMIAVVLPGQLQDLAGIRGVLAVEVAPPIQLGRVLDAIETTCPTLRGTLRDQSTGRRRAMVRFYADGIDLSDVEPDCVLPQAVIDGSQQLRVVGAISGG